MSRKLHPLSLPAHEVRTSLVDVEARCAEVEVRGEAKVLLPVLPSEASHTVVELEARAGRVDSGVSHDIGSCYVRVVGRA